MNTILFTRDIFGNYNAATNIKFIASHKMCRAFKNGEIQSLNITEIVELLNSEEITQKYEDLIDKINGTLYFNVPLS